jgi:hypothetical protein
MTSAATWPPHPARIRHAWRCARRGPIVEAVTLNQTGQAQVVAQCQECGENELAERIRTEHTARLT